MKNRFKKITLSLAMVSVLLSAVNGNAGESTITSADSAAGTRQKAPKTRLVSVNSAGTAGGNGQSSQPKLSVNGRFVAFYSLASDLVANDTNGLGDIFVRDLKTGKTMLATINLFGASSVYDLSDAEEDQFFDRPVPELSANGRYVAFHSNAADLVTNKNDGFSGIFVRDLKTAKTTWVSPAGIFYFPKLSDKGRYVAFMSFTQAYVHDRKSGKTTLATVNLAGMDGEYFGDDDPLTWPVLSPNGRFVAFRSNSSDLVANDFNGGLDNAFSGAASDLFVRDLKTGKTTLVSVNRAGIAGGYTTRPSDSDMSANGRFVKFRSQANNLVANDNNDTIDSFVRDLKAGTTILASEFFAKPGNRKVFPLPPGTSADGRFVAFVNGKDIFIRPTRSEDWKRK